MPVTQSNSATFDRIAVPYDRGMAPLERLWLGELRRRLVSQASGRVLEIGVGTGANFPYYSTSSWVAGIDESSEMLEVAAWRTRQVPHQTCLNQMDVEALAFPSRTFDAIVASLVLCSVVDLERALAEMRRVLHRPTGRLLLLEHQRPEGRLGSSLVELLNVPWLAFNGRCHLNRETQSAIARAGFELLQVESRLGGLLRLIVARHA